MTGFCLKLGSALISWQAKKQSVTSQSTAEAEYRALASITTEIMWLKYLLADLHVFVIKVVPVFCDNQAAVDIANNPVHHARTKHIELDCHFIREKVQAGIISPQKISTKHQLADIFTKGLGGVAHWYICSKLGLHNPCVSPVCGGSNTESTANCSHFAATVQLKPQHKATIQLALSSQINKELQSNVWF